MVISPKRFPVHFHRPFPCSSKFLVKTRLREPHRVGATSLRRNLVDLCFKRLNRRDNCLDAWRRNSNPVGVALSSAVRTISRAPPRSNAIRGVPQACASAITMPKSSQPAKMNAFALAIVSRKAARGR